MRMHLALYVYESVIPDLIWCLLQPAALCKAAKHSTRKGAVGMQRGNGSTGKSGKSYVIQFMSDKERNEWLDMIMEFKKRNAVNPISFV